MNSLDAFSPFADLPKVETDQETSLDSFSPFADQPSPVVADAQAPSPDSVVADLPTAPVPQPESQPFPNMMPVSDPLGGDVTNELMSPEPSGPSVYPSVFDAPDPRTVEIEAEQARLTDVASQLGPTIDKANMNVNEGLSQIKGTPGKFTMNINGSDVPIDDESAIKTLSQTNTYQLPESSLLSGFVRLNKAVALIGTRVGMTDPQQAFKMIGMFNRIAPDTPKDVADALQEMTREGMTIAESFNVAIRNPKAILYVVGESFPMSMPSLAAFLGGTVLGSPKTGVATGAAATYAIQYSDTIMDEMQSSGVDMKDDAAMLAAFSDPDFMDRARTRANARSIPIAFFDAMSMGLSGKFLAMATSGKASVGKTIVGGAGETVQQGITGGLGEFVAQDLETRLGFRKAINWGEVNLEILAEGPVGAVETAIAGIGTAEKKKAQQAAASLETNAINETALQLQNPQGKGLGFVDGDEKLESAEFAATDMKSRIGRIAAQVEDESSLDAFSPFNSVTTDSVDSQGGSVAPLSPPVNVNTPSLNTNQTTSAQINNLQKKSEEAARLAQQTEDNIKASEGKAVDLDADRNDALFADAQQYAESQRAKAADLARQAQELQKFYATTEGQRYASAIEALQKQADDEGLNVNIAARLNTVPTTTVDEAIEFARSNLDQQKSTATAKAGNAPPVPFEPITDVNQILNPLEGRQTKAAEGSFISAEEKQIALDALNPLIEKLNRMGFAPGQSLNSANSTPEARDLRSQIIRVAGIYNELQSQRLARDKQHKNFKPENLARIEKQFNEELRGNLSDEDFNAIMKKALDDGRFNTAYLVSNGMAGLPAKTVNDVVSRAEKAGLLTTDNGDILNADEMRAKFAPVSQPAPQPEADQANPQAAEPLAFAAEIIPKNGQTSIKTPGSFMNVKVKPVYVDMADLKEATGVLQPRDRSRGESDLQVRDIASKLDPDQLANSPISTSGAPVIARDGTLITGNGRKKAIDLAYKEFPEQAVNYRQGIKRYGSSDIGNGIHAVDNMEKPVLVFMIDEDLTLDQLANFADQSNVNPVATMAATERAKRDARVMGLGLARKFQGGDMGSAANRSFVKEFIQGVVAPTEQNQMSNNGVLTLEGEQRMRAAILGVAFDHSNNLVKMLESRDDNVKAITNAMLDAAPAIAGLKADIKDGIVPAEFDISINITEAARHISEARAQGIKVADMLAQQDAFSQMSVMTEALIVAFYNDNLTRARSGKFITDILKLYVDEANQKREGGMFEDTTTPKDIIETVRRRADGNEGQGGLFTEDGSSEGAKTSSEQAQRGSRTRSSQDTRRSLKPSAEAGRQGAVNDRPVSAETSDRGTDSEGTTDGAIVSLDALDQAQNQRTEEPGTLLSKEAERNKTALMFTAFADADLDPNIAVNFPVARQVKILSQQMVNRFGLNIEVSTKANLKDARDQLLVGYHQLSMLASAFNLPYKAIGLEGNLTFAIAKNINAYGMYNPGSRTITVPRRVNSFGHEWFHALDHYIFERFNEIPVGKYGMQTDAVRGEGADAFAENTPTGLKESYIALLKALFKDKAGDAAQLNAIEQKINEFETRNFKKDFRNMETWKRLDGQRQRLLEGTGRGKLTGKTQFRRDAEFFAGISMSDANYWTSPREMFARAGESFISRQMMLQGSNADFLAKSQDAYNMTLDDLKVDRDALAKGKGDVNDARLALTFPKEAEMMEIFGAYKNLLDALAAETILGEGEVGKTPGDNFVIDVRNMHGDSAEKALGYIAEQKKIFRERKIFLARMEGRAKEYQKYGGPRLIGSAARKTLEDSVTAPLFYQKKSIIKMLIGRYPNSQGLRRLFNQIGTDTGGELQSTAKGGNLLDSQARMVRIFSDRLKNIIKKHDIVEFNDAEISQLRMILTSQDQTDSAPSKVVAAAGDFRLMYDSLYEYMRGSGIEIGYAKSGYMQRLLDHVEIHNDKAGFEDAAKKVYRIVFQNEVGKEFDGTVEQAQEIISFIGEKRIGIAGEPQYQSFVKSDVWGAITGFIRDKKKAEADNDATALAAAEADLEALLEDPETQELLETFYNEMEETYSNWSSALWSQAIAEGQVGDPQTSGAPQSDFRKERTLPPEADAIMEKYYISDPTENLTTYILGAVRKAEYNRRFGKHLIPKGENPGNKYQDYLAYTLAKIASRDRLLSSELNLLSESVDTMLGRNVSGYTANSPQKVANRLSALLSITLLIRAPIASIAEPITTALTTNDTATGMKAFVMTLQELPKVRDMSKNRAEDIRLRGQFARIMGVIDDPEVGDIIANRIGGEFAGDKNLNKMMSSFFYKIKLAGITNAQRRTASRIGFQYLTEMAYAYKNPINEKEKLTSNSILNDMGVADERIDQFVDYLLSFNNVERAKGIRDTLLRGEGKGKVKGKLYLPAAEDVMKDDGLYTDMGEQLAVSIMRFVDMTIQDPRSSDRPTYAEHPIGRFVYGIMSFVYSFQDKVLFAMARRASRAKSIASKTGSSAAAANTEGGAYLAATIAGPLLALVTAHMLVSTLREFLLSRERWDREWDEADEDVGKFFKNYLLPLGASRAGLTGAFDPIYQAFTGMKYQRDIATSLTGTGSYILTSGQDILSPLINNTPNTLYSEYRFLRGLWNLTVNPAVSTAIAIAPLSPANALGATGAAQYITSTSTRDKAINLMLESIYGEGYVRGSKGKTKKTRPKM